MWLKMRICSVKRRSSDEDSWLAKHIRSHQESFGKLGKWQTWVKSFLSSLAFLLLILILFNVG